MTKTLDYLRKKQTVAGCPTEHSGWHQHDQSLRFRYSIRQRAATIPESQVPNDGEREEQWFRRVPPPQLLDDLHNDFGIPWNDIAKVAGVSRHAVRKWRENSSHPGRKHFQQVCRLAAFGERLRSLDGELSSWISTQLDFRDGEPSPITVADILARGAFEVAMKHFLNEYSDQQVLSEVFPSIVQVEADSAASVSLVDGMYVAELTGMPVVAEGRTLDEVKALLEAEVREFVESWFITLRNQSGFADLAGGVVRLSEADRHGRLTETLFGA